MYDKILVKDHMIINLNFTKYSLLYVYFYNFANFLFLFNRETRKLIRNILKNIEKKLINYQLAIVFNETCLNIYIYLYLYIYISIARRIKILSEQRVSSHIACIYFQTHITTNFYWQNYEKCFEF